MLYHEAQWLLIILIMRLLFGALDLFNEMIDGELSQIQLLWWLVHYKHVQLLVVQKSVRRSMNMLLGKVLS